MSRCFPWICIAKQCKSNGTVECSVHFPTIVGQSRKNVLKQREKYVETTRRTSLTYRLNYSYSDRGLATLLPPSICLHCSDYRYIRLFVYIQFFFYKKSKIFIKIRNSQKDLKDKSLCTRRSIIK